MASEQSAANRSVTFSIDGRTFSVDDPHQTAADLLQLAGLDPALYDLARMRAGNASRGNVRRLRVRPASTRRSTS